MSTATDSGNSTAYQSRGAYRLEIQVNFDFTGGLHIGAGGHLSVDTDSPIVLDADGNAILLASSIRGVLRHWAQREACVCGVKQDAFNRLFGPDIEAQKDKKGKIVAGRDAQGRLTIYDAQLTLPAQQQEIRDHIRLDPETETVASGGKFDQAVALASKGSFKMLYEGDKADNPDNSEIHLLKSLCDALQAGFFSLGAKSGTGLGWLENVKLSYEEHQRSNMTDLSRYLLSRLEGKQSNRDDQTAFVWPTAVDPIKQYHDKLPPLNFLRLTGTLHFNGPMLVGGIYRGDDGVGSKARELADDGWITKPDGTPYLPGSALRGVLSTQARRITNSLNCPDLFECLFGYVKTDSEKQTEQARKGLLKVSEGQISGAAHPIFMNHVAIDRISGFASDGALFNVAALSSPQFSFSLRCFWEPNDPKQQAAIMLLLFILRDLEDGQLWLGANTTAGYGHIERVTWQDAYLSHLNNENSAWKREKEDGLSSVSAIKDLMDIEAFKTMMNHWQNTISTDSQKQEPSHV